MEPLLAQPCLVLDLVGVALDAVVRLPNLVEPFELLLDVDANAFERLDVALVMARSSGDPFVGKRG